MNGINKHIIIGTLKKDPETRYMPNGNAVTEFSVAVNEKWKDKQGQPQERTEWINCEIFGKLAEIAAQYLTKGSQVYLEGKQRTEKWQDQQGQDRYTTKTIIDVMQMLGGGQSQHKPQQSGFQQPQQQQGFNQPHPNQTGMGFNPNQGGFEPDPDIPF